MMKIDSGIFMLYERQEQENLRSYRRTISILF